MTNKHNHQRGVALITVMLIVALAAILATEMTARLQHQLQRSSNIQFNQQAYWYAMGAEAFAKRVLVMDNEKEDEVTNLQQQWAQGYNNFPVPQGEISGGLFDLHACLNLNALRAIPENANNNPNQEVPARAALERLIVNLGVEGVSEFEAEYMADALTDWLDENDQIASAGGAEDNDYASKEFPYLAANSFLASVQELRVVEHFTPAVINELKAYTCIIPGSDAHKININTLTEEQLPLLQALLDITVDEAKSIIDARDPEGFDNIDDFKNMPELTELNLTDEQKQQFVVDSEYFTLKANAQFNNSYFNLVSTLQVVDNSQVSVIGRTIGRF
ncbi:type II secretion system minor pseudopilin GspK [Thalassotalea euphylliae]|uniref:type II secretion system minor pseudopilin GspK n=1 Tax=Thalassotalea euphylliae TaxID=1655234 RepID=UPI0036253AB2